MEIKAIETEYNGYRFRSRLEARWAVFFDSLGVKYEYEPEGYELPSGKRYLPDFKVKCYGKRGIRDAEPFDLFIEVKGEMTKEDEERIVEFAGAEKEEITDDFVSTWFEVRNPVLIVSQLPNVGEYDYDYNDMSHCEIAFNYWLIDGDWFGAYPAAHDGHFYLFGADGNYINTDDIPQILQAYDNARKARFEHGEKPKV